MRDRLFEVLGEALRIPADQVTMELKFGDVLHWDSAGHLELMLAVEDAFGVQFSSREIGELTSVAALATRLEALTG